MESSKPVLRKAKSAPALGRYSVEESCEGGAARQPESCNSFAPDYYTTRVKTFWARRHRIRGSLQFDDYKRPIEAVDDGHTKCKSKPDVL